MSVTGTAGGRIAPGVGANLIGQHAHDRNQEATCYVGNLDPQVNQAWQGVLQTTMHACMHAPHSTFMVTV